MVRSVVTCPKCGAKSEARTVAPEGEPCDLCRDGTFAAMVAKPSGMPGEGAFQCPKGHFYSVESEESEEAPAEESRVRLSATLSLKYDHLGVTFWTESNPAGGYRVCCDRGGITSNSDFGTAWEAAEAFAALVKGDAGEPPQ
jgi:hypothetical protein